MTKEPDSSIEIFNSFRISVTPQTLSFYKLGRMLKDVAFS